MLKNVKTRTPMQLLTILPYIRNRVLDMAISPGLDFDINCIAYTSETFSAIFIHPVHCPRFECVRGHWGQPGTK